MTHAIGIMANEIYETVKNDCSIYLYGSVTLDDFREGWSDIDIIALTGHKMSDDEENTLVYLRQKMMKDNPIYRSFEGVILPLADLISETPSRAVYWGTSGQRITDDFTADLFLMKQLTTSAKLLIGNDIRAGLREPSYDELVAAISAHLDCVRNHASATGHPLYSYGWLLADLPAAYGPSAPEKSSQKPKPENGHSKTTSAPTKQPYRYALRARKAPLAAKNAPGLMQVAGMIAPAIQTYADVLEAELKKVK